MTAKWWRCRERERERCAVPGLATCGKQVARCQGIAITNASISRSPRGLGVKNGTRQTAKKNKRNEKRKQKANADAKREEERKGGSGVRANESWPGSDSVPPPPSNDDLSYQHFRCHLCVFALRVGPESWLRNALCDCVCVILQKDRGRERGARATAPWQATRRCSCQSCLSCPPGVRDLRRDSSLLQMKFDFVEAEFKNGSAALSHKESRKYTGWLMQAILTASARELALRDYCELCSQINNKSLLYLVSYQCEEGSIFALWRSWVGDRLEKEMLFN